MPLKKKLLKKRESVYKTWEEDSDWKIKTLHFHTPDSRDFSVNLFYNIHMLHFIMLIFIYV